jgi:hypothetical protein
VSAPSLELSSDILNRKPHVHHPTEGIPRETTGWSCSARARRAVASAELFFWQFLHCLLIRCRVSEEEAGKMHVQGELWRHSHKII